MTVTRNYLYKQQKPTLTTEMLAEIEALKQMQPNEIDLTDAPEERDWSNAVRVNFFAKKPFESFSQQHMDNINVVLDNDILDWLKNKHGNLNQYINNVLRQTMQQEQMA